jgi:hypothetical protein
VEGDFAVLGYSINSPGVEAADQVMDGAMAIAINVMRQLCGPDWKPVEVLFAHRKPLDTGPFRRFFQAPLSFDAEQSALVFSADWLEHPVAAADPELRRLLQKQVDALAARYRYNFPGQARSERGSAASGRVASLKQVLRASSVRRGKTRRSRSCSGVTRTPWPASPEGSPRRSIAAPRVHAVGRSPRGRTLGRYLTV